MREEVEPSHQQNGIDEQFPMLLEHDTGFAKENASLAAC